MGDMISLDSISTYNNQTLLHFYALRPCPSQAEVLLESFFNLNHIDNFGNTPLHLSSDSTFFSLLLSHGASFLNENNEGSTPVHNIIVKDLPLLFRSLFRFSDSWIKMNVSRIIDLQIVHRSIKTMKVLYELCPDEFKGCISHAISESIQENSKEILIYLIDIDHNSLKEALYYDINSQEIAYELIWRSGLEYISSISKEVHNPLFRKAIKYAASLGNSWRTSDICISQSPLHIAAEKNDFSFIKTEKYSYVDIIDFHGQTPLFYSIMYNCRKSVVELILRGANPSHPKSIITPLHICCAIGDVYLLRIMLRSKPNLECKDQNGKTPILYAAKMGNECVGFLIKAGADLKATASNGNSILHYLAKTEITLSVVTEAIQHGAPTTKENMDGQTPYQIALHYRKNGAAAFIDPLDVPISFFECSLSWADLNIWVILNYLSDEWIRKEKNILIICAASFCRSKDTFLVVLRIVGVLDTELLWKAVFSSIEYDNQVSLECLLTTYPSVKNNTNNEGIGIIEKSIFSNAGSLLFSVLIEHEADFSVKNNNNENIFHLAVGHQNESIFDFASHPMLFPLLLCENNNGLIPLELAFIRKYDYAIKFMSKIVQLPIFCAPITYKNLRAFFDKGMPAKVHDSNGLSLIVFTIQTSQTEAECYQCVELCLENHGDVSKFSSSGITAAEVSIIRQMPSIFMLIMEHGGVLGCLSIIQKRVGNLFSEGFSRVIQAHENRANFIQELSKTETNYLEQLSVLCSMSKEIMSVCSQLAPLLFHARSIMSISQTFSKRLNVMVRRLSPNTKVGWLLIGVANLIRHFRAYVVSLHNFFEQRSQIPSYDQVTKLRSSYRKYIVDDLLIVPIQRISRYPLIIDQIIRETPKNHPDYPDLNQARVLWYNMAHMCDNLANSYQSRSPLQKLKIKFMANFGANEFDDNDYLLCHGKFSVIKANLINSNIFKNSKASVYLFLFKTKIWIGYEDDDRSITIYLVIDSVDSFFDFTMKGDMVLYFPFGYYELRCYNGDDSALWVGVTSNIIPPFNSNNPLPKLIRCSWVSNETKNVESSILLLDCQSSESALFEIHKLLRINALLTRFGKALIHIVLLSECSNPISIVS